MEDKADSAVTEHRFKTEEISSFCRDSSYRNSSYRNSSYRNYIGCPHCDLLLKRKPFKFGQKIRCPRCGYLLLERKKKSVERTFAVSLAGLLAFIPAITLPLLGLRAGGLENEASLIQCIEAVMASELYLAGLLILLFCIVIPFLRLSIILYLAWQIMKGRYVSYGIDLYRFYHESEEWGMLEVFLLGMVVSLYKILGLAEAIFDVGLVAFILLLSSATLVTYFLDEQHFWERLSDRK